MRTVTTTFYTFDELSPEAQLKAIEEIRNSQNYPDHWWHEDTITDAKAIGKLMGIHIDKVYFSGFCSQGDGACFTGDYWYVKGGLKALKAYAPKDDVLHSIAKNLQTIQKGNSYRLNAKLTHRGHYSHSNTMYAEVTDDRGNFIEGDIETELESGLRSFADWIYRNLEKSYDHLRSDEAIRDYLFFLDGSEYKFTETGESISH